MSTFFSVIFDNGGGITIQTDDGFCHHYDYPAQAAQDVQILLDGGSTAGWDGNDGERMDYDGDVERNGGYLWHDEQHVRKVLAAGTYDTPWGRNAQNFYEALGVVVPED